MNEMQKPGNFELRFDGSNLASGVYFYRLQSGNYIQAKKLILLRLQDGISK